MGERKILAFTHETRAGFRAPERGGQPEYIPIEELTLQDGTLLPIATTSTLPPNYFETVGLDVRYPKDRSRLEAMERALIHPELEILPQARKQIFDCFAQGLIESKPIELAYQAGAENEPAMHELIENVVIVRPLEDLTELWKDTFSLPKSLRDFVFEDPGTALEVARICAHMASIDTFVDTATLLAHIDALGLRELRGVARLTALCDNLQNIADIIQTQAEQEKERIAAGNITLQKQRLERKHYAHDTVDARMFRVGTNTGTIVDPSYLFSPIYESLGDEPEVDDRSKLLFLRHMLAGEWVYGHDHIYLYRNKFPDIANQRIGIAPDYSVVRPGNYLFHDLMLIETGPYGNDFPLDPVLEYAIMHYIYQMDMHVVGEDPEPPAASINFVYKGEEIVVPLKHEPKHVIPFRALKKDLASAEYFEYSEECYIAELVDIALELDYIETHRSTSQDGSVVGDVQLGKHASQLLGAILEADARVGTNILVLATRQMLFMYGREATRDSLNVARESATRTATGAIDGLESVVTTPELTADGEPQPVRRPLTCYFEWFNKYAQPITEDELRKKGIPVVAPPLANY